MLQHKIHCPDEFIDARFFSLKMLTQQAFLLICDPCYYSPSHLSFLQLIFLTILLLSKQLTLILIIFIFYQST